MLTFRSFVLVCASMLFAFSAQADRTITDQLGRQVTIPDHVDKVVVLQHQTLNILVQLNAQQDIVGVMSSWKKQLGPEFARFMPTITTLPTPGDLTSVNIESLLAIHPQVVFVANYAPAGDDPADSERRYSGRGYLVTQGCHRATE